MELVARMAPSSQSTELDITKLREFHASHFHGSPVPNITTATAHCDLRQDHQVAHDEAHETEDGLGYYDDGVERTLTDEQIRIFRHSEVQRLLAARRREAEEREDDRPQGRDNEGRPDETTAAQHKDEARGSKNYGDATGVKGRDKRMNHFDDPQDEDADVVLEY